MTVLIKCTRGVMATMAYPYSPSQFLYIIPNVKKKITTYVPQGSSDSRHFFFFFFFIKLAAGGGRGKIIPKAERRMPNAEFRSAVYHVKHVLLGSTALL